MINESFKFIYEYLGPQKSHFSKCINFSYTILVKSMSKTKKREEIRKKIVQKSQRYEMMEQEAHRRILNFNEVALGFTIEEVKLEAKRCLQCSEPKCVLGCPINIDIPDFIKNIKENDFREASRCIKKSNYFPSICGRVCPQENQCEKTCILERKGKQIAIGALERFIGDWEKKYPLDDYIDYIVSNSINVAIIGSGPAGLTCAVELARKGYHITIFEALHKGGGVLTYGIPEFRLPKEIVKNEIESLEKLDVKIQYNTVIGKTLTLKDLRQNGFKAIFIGVGAGMPIFPKISGLNLNGVLTANEFLTRVNLMKACRFPEYDTPIKIGKIVTIIGGGNTAIDSARVALRLGAEKVTIVYRRSETELPANKKEYHHAIEEGIFFQFLTNPAGIIGDNKNNVTQLKLIKMKLGKVDECGRKKPIPIPNSEFLIKTDTVVLAIGTRANPILTRSIPELKLNKYGYIVTDEFGRTNIDDIFAGGDIVSGSATVIYAMGAGRKAAMAMENYLKAKIRRNSIQEGSSAL